MYILLNPYQLPTMSTQFNNTGKTLEKYRLNKNAFDSNANHPRKSISP